jgi:TorA maturation chaperone TorD
MKLSTLIPCPMSISIDNVHHHQYFKSLFNRAFYQPTPSRICIFKPTTHSSTSFKLLLIVRRRYVVVSGSAELEIKRRAEAEAAVSNHHLFKFWGSLTAPTYLSKYLEDMYVHLGTSTNSSRQIATVLACSRAIRLG